MRNTSKKSKRFLAKNGKKPWLKVVSCLTSVLVFCTAYASNLSAIAVDGENVAAQAVYCGLEEHTHSDACYDKGEPTCGQDASEGHTHAESCYEKTDELTCGKTEGHQHTEDCYETQEGWVCGLEESEGHTHTEVCYGETYTCGDESEDHQHSDDCRLTCGLAESEGHTHNEGCVGTKEVLTCTLEKTEAHTHTDDCYKTLICKQEETAAHTHTLDCYSEKELICEKKEHTHTETCYQKPSTVSTQTYSGNEYTVTASWEEGTFQDDVTLTASQYTVNDTKYDLLGQTVSYGLTDGRAILDIYPFDISFADSNGNKVEPNGSVTVTISLPVQMDGESSWIVFHVSNTGNIAEVYDNETGEVVFNGKFEELTPSFGTDSTGTAFTFTTTSFSDFVVVNTTAASVMALNVNKLDGKTFALVNVKQNAAILATQTTNTAYRVARLSAQKLEGRYSRNSDYTYTVIKDSNSNTNVCFWTFEKVPEGGNNQYYIYTNITENSSNVRKYIQISEPSAGFGNSDVKTVTNQNEASIITVSSNESDSTGQVRLTLTNSKQAINLFGDKIENGFGGWSKEDNTPASSEYFYLVSAISDAGRPLNENQTVSPAGTVINLFDYWLTAREAPDVNVNGANQGINAGHALKFSHNGDKNNEIKASGAWNIWTGNENVYPGIVEGTLGADGYPYLSNGKVSSSESLDYLFAPTDDPNCKKAYSNVKNLLQIDSDGYYYYNSQWNFAEFNPDYKKESGEFTLYDTWGVTAGGTSPNGQFFPFNSFEKSASYSSIDPKGEINHYFGMTLTARFTQQYEGHTTSGKQTPMTFEFSGDDDVWIFIDGVLVADLGGIHDAASVKIDFSDGSVEINGQSSTSLRQAFTNARKDVSNFTDEGIFEDNTYHTLKFYYLERGNTDSNLYLRYNLSSYPPTGLYKVNQYGEKVTGAEFEVYRANKDYTITSQNPVYTGTTDLNGQMIFVDTDGSPLTLSEIEERFGTYFVLKETKVPDGYRLVSDEIHLHIYKNKVLLCENTFESGVWASSTLQVTAPTTLTLAHPYNGENTVKYYGDGSIEDDGTTVPTNGTVFAVVLKYIGPRNMDGNATDLSEQKYWAPVYGTDLKGFTVVNVNDPKYGGNFISAAIDTARNYEESQNVFAATGNGEMQGTLNGMPGDIRNYYYMLDDSEKGKTEYTVAYYWTSAKGNDPLASANSNNTYRINADDSTNKFYRTFGATINVPNLVNRMFAQKLDEKGNLVNGATFALYNVEEANGKIYYIADGQDETKIYLEPDTDGDNQGTATVGKNGGTYKVDGTTGEIEVTIDGTPYTISPAKNGQSQSLIGVTTTIAKEEGTAEFDYLKAGKYYLREISAPLGYTLNTAEVMVYVTENAIYANAGSADDGVTVARGPGYLVSSLQQFASQGDIDNTLTWVYERLRVNPVSHTFDAFRVDPDAETWQYLTQNNSTVLTSDKDKAFTIYLKYDTSDTANTLFNYTINEGRYAEGVADTVQRRLYTPVGWSYYEIYQDSGYGKGKAVENGANYQELDIELAHLFSRSIYVQVTDKYSTTFTPVAIKTLNGGTPRDGSFRFTLWKEGENKTQVGTAYNVGSSVTFEPLVFTKAGVYTYYLQEDRDYVRGYEFAQIGLDYTIYELRIVVAEEDGSLKVTSSSYAIEDSPYNGTPIFQNKMTGTPPPEEPSEPGSRPSSEPSSEPGSEPSSEPSEPVSTPSEESSEPSVTPSEPEKKPDEVEPLDNTPQTSDESNLSLWLIILAVSAVGLVVALFFERKNRYTPKHFR